MAVPLLLCCKSLKKAPQQLRLPGKVMAKVPVLNVAVLENQSPFHSPFRFEISFKCSEALSDNLEWKIICVGSAGSKEFDQSLDSVLEALFLQEGICSSLRLMPQTHPSFLRRVGVLIPCTYHGQEFIRVSYYVNNDYPHPELRENPPPNPDFSQLQQNILASNSWVTRFHINWDNNPDRLEAIENQDPNVDLGLPLSCTPKSLGLPSCIPALLPENSMDCI